MRKPRIRNKIPPCKSYQCNVYDEPLEFDCGYQTGIFCEDCICMGGRINPLTNKKFKKYKKFIKTILRGSK